MGGGKSSEDNFNTWGGGYCKTYMHKYVCTHAHIHTYIQTYIQICLNQSNQSNHKWVSVYKKPNIQFECKRARKILARYFRPKGCTLFLIDMQAYYKHHIRLVLMIIFTKKVTFLDYLILIFFSFRYPLTQ